MDDDHTTSPFSDCEELRTTWAIANGPDSDQPVAIPTGGSPIILLSQRCSLAPATAIEPQLLHAAANNGTHYKQIRHTNIYSDRTVRASTHTRPTGQPRRLWHPHSPSSSDDEHSEQMRNLVVQHKPLRLRSRHATHCSKAARCYFHKPQPQPQLNPAPENEPLRTTSGSNRTRQRHPQTQAHGKNYSRISDSVTHTTHTSAAQYKAMSLLFTK